MTDSKQKIQKCFTIMPFSVRADDLKRYGDNKDHWSDVYQGLIIPAVRAAGLSCERDDEDVASRFITENIWRKLEDADIVLCDLSAHNPNVYLELGWVLRSDKRFVLIKDDITKFSFNLNQSYTTEYSHYLQPTQLALSVADLSKAILTTLADNLRRYSLVEKLHLQHQAVEAAQGNLEVSIRRELLNEARSPWLNPGLSAVDKVCRMRPTSPIRDNSDLILFLVGTTWRKSNDVEHLIFDLEGIVWNNHAGHPNWRKNTFMLGASLGELTIVWSVDHLYAQCEFSEDFTEFIENRKPGEGTWRLVATAPHTPLWGI